MALSSASSAAGKVAVSLLVVAAFIATRLGFNNVSCLILIEFYASIDNERITGADPAHAARTL
jgi:hypothetical protein